MTREEVVKWLESLKRETGKAENRTLWHYAESIDMAIKALSHEARPTGEWIQKDMYADRFCSECNYAVWDSEAEEYNFCPNCGADMRGEKHE